MKPERARVSGGQEAGVPEQDGELASLSLTPNQFT